VLIYKKKKEKSNGLILGLALALIFLARFIIEFFKENQVDFESGMLINMGQILSVPFIIIGLILILARKKPSVQHSI
jgi:prolipoprotein diacylglyceryltransferase